MNENKNQRLAREITDFCKEHLKSPSVKPKGAKTLLQTARASFLALTFVGGGTGTNKETHWI